MQILWGSALYFLITCIGIEKEKVRQSVADYKLELKISECMLVNFEFMILIWNLKFLEKLQLLHSHCTDVQNRIIFNWTIQKYTLSNVNDLISW